MALICFPGVLNPFCRQTVCISPCSDKIALVTSSSITYLYSYSNATLSFITKFIPHLKSVSCMIFHPTKPGVLVSGGAPNSRVNFWLIEGKRLEKQSTFCLQRKPNAFIWITDEELIIGDEHGNIYRLNDIEQKLSKFSSQSLSDKQNDEIQLIASANKQKFIMAIGYKSGFVVVCHVDLEKTHLNVLHKLPPDSTHTVCCSIQFAHFDSPLDRSTNFYISYGHGCIKVYDYINGKMLGQLTLVKQAKANNVNDLRCKTYYPLAWVDSNTLLTGNLDGHLIKIDIQRSSSLEKSLFNVTPPASGGKPMFSLGMKEDKYLFTYSYNRKLCIYDIPSMGLTNSLISIPGSINSIQACPLQTSCIALGLDTGNVGILDLSSCSSPALTFLWQSIPADVYHVAWHPLREGRISYSTRLGHIALHDTLTGRSRVVYDWRYTQVTNVFWGPLMPSLTEDPTLAILYSVGDGKFHRWDSPDKNCAPVDITTSVNDVIDTTVVNVAISDDHKYLSVLCSDMSLVILTCPALSLVHRLPIDCLPTVVSYHPRYLLSSTDASSKQHWIAVNDKNNIRLIDTLESKSCIINDFIGHTDTIKCLSWSPYIDNLLASGSQDRTIRLWNVETKSQLKIYTEHSDAVLSLIFSSLNPHIILSGSRDQSLHIWSTEQHTQSPDQPIIFNINDDEDEVVSNGGSRKRHNKSRPNRAEREKRRAAKTTSYEMNGEENGHQTPATNSAMNELNSLAYRLLWPSETDRQNITDLSSLPNKITLFERIKQHNFDTKNDCFYHILYWCNEHQQLIGELSQGNITSSTNLFFWMAILNSSSEIQSLFDRTFDLMKENHDERILEFITLMIRLQRKQELIEYLIKHDHIELSIFLAVIFESIDNIRGYINSSTDTEDI